MAPAVFMLANILPALQSSTVARRFVRLNYLRIAQTLALTSWTYCTVRNRKFGFMKKSRNTFANKRCQLLLVRKLIRVSGKALINGVYRYLTDTRRTNNRCHAYAHFNS